MTGDYLVFEDKNGNERVYIGDDGTGNVIFMLQNATGTEGVYMDGTGKVSLTGNIETSKDCRIWGELIVGYGGSNKGISLYRDTNTSTPSELCGKMFPYIDPYDDKVQGIGIDGNMYIKGSNGAYFRVLTTEDFE